MNQPIGLASAISATRYSTSWNTPLTVIGTTPARAARTTGTGEAPARPGPRARRSTSWLVSRLPRHQAFAERDQADGGGPARQEDRDVHEVAHAPTPARNRLSIEAEHHTDDQRGIKTHPSRIRKS